MKFWPHTLVALAAGVLACSPDTRAPTLEELVAEWREERPDFDNPLHYFAMEGDSTEVALLLAAGVDPNARTEYGNTPLHLAVLHNDALSVARVLIVAGADPTAKREDGTTPLHQAQSAEAIQILVAAGADPNARDERGDTPLRWVETVGEIVALLEAGADPNATGRLGPPLYAAARFPTALGVEALLSAGADPTRGRPLHRAESAEVIAALIAAGADPNGKDWDGDTPLHVAARDGNAEAIRALLAGGANPNAFNAAYETPRSLAAAAGLPEW